MAYEPLHHKYRPQTFEQLVGQGAIAQTLSNALTSGRIAPAYLFTGPRGTGKTSSSRILAKSLNCIHSEHPTPQPCGECQICHEITAGRAMDIVEIDAASNTGVDNIREIIERAQFAPVQCRYKVYVIDECHMLSTAAFNALLKTLEEPPDRVVFVLATTDPQRVLNTIISRCQRFDFRRIPLQAMVQHLGMIAQNEAISITPEALTLVAQIANGGLRDAESLLDQLSLLETEITPEQVWDLVGAVPEQDLLALIQSIRNDNPEATLSQCRSMLERGREPLIVLQNLATFYLNLLIAKTSPQRQDLVAVTRPTWDSLCQLAPAWQIAEILQGQQQLKESESQLRNTTQPRLWLEVTLLGLLPSALAIAATPLPSTQRSVNSQPSPTQTHPVTTPQTQTPAIASTPTLPTSTSQISSTPTPSIPAVPPPSDPVAPLAAIASPVPSNDEQFERRVQESWQRVLQAIEPPATRALVEQKCTLVDFDTEDGIATIGVASQPLLKLAEGRVPNIANAFEKVWQQTVQVLLRVQKAPQASSTTTRSPAAPAPPTINSSPPPFDDVASSLPPIEPKSPSAPHPFGETVSHLVTPPVSEKSAPDAFASPELLETPPPKPALGEKVSSPSNVVLPLSPNSTPDSHSLANNPECNDYKAAPSNGQCLTANDSQLTQIVQDFAAEFGQIIDFRPSSGTY